MPARGGPTGCWFRWMAEGPVHDLGWRNSSPQAALAFLPPVMLGELQEAPPGLAERIIVVRASFDLALRFTRPTAPRQGVVRVREPGDLTDTGFRGLVSPILPSALREPEVQAIQVSLNLVMVSDVPCSLLLMPPYLSPGFRDWPGPLVSGRFPLAAWPRPLNAILEWQEREREWRLKRGDALAYLLPEYSDPAARPRLVEAVATPALTRQMARVDNVIAYGRNVGPMFAEAAQRRPPVLLHRKATVESD